MPGTTRMDPDIKDLWVKRLRSLKESKHGFQVLKNAEGKMCPLGVLCELAVEAGVIEPPYLNEDGVYQYGFELSVLPLRVSKWANMKTVIQIEEDEGLIEFPMGLTSNPTVKVPSRGLKNRHGQDIPYLTRSIAGVNDNFNFSFYRISTLIKNSL